MSQLSFSRSASLSQGLYFYLKLCRLFEGGRVDGALDKLSRALHVEPDFQDGRSYMLHIKNQKQAREVRDAGQEKRKYVAHGLRVYYLLGINH